MKLRNRIELFDEYGEKREFEVVATFGLDDVDYAILIPIDQSGEGTWLFRMEKDDKGELLLKIVEDDQEIKDAYSAYESLMKEKMQ